MMQQRTSQPVAPQFEPLEGRTMMSGMPLAITQVSFQGGTQLKITGTSGGDQITVKKASNGLIVGNTGGWTKTFVGTFKSILVESGAGSDSVTLDAAVNQNSILYGGEGCDTLTGGAGADRIFGGGGSDKCTGGAGNDTVIGGVGDNVVDACIGGAGNDTFWADIKENITDIVAAETNAGLVHRISNFAFGNANNAVPSAAKVNAGKDLLDPILTSSSYSYKNFSTNPLFSSVGPKANDISQGAVGDCYFLAVLSSIAKVDPQLIKQSITELGDGTYAVQFNQGNVKTFVRVDGDLPTYSWGGLAYADTGAEGSVWVAIMEKAFTYFRTGAGTYASIAAGWMNEVYSDFGKTSNSYYSSGSSSWLLNTIKTELAAGKSVTYAAKTANGAPLIGSHAYMVDSIVTDSNGVATGIKLRNPWGVDGAGSDGNNDGYVIITADQAQASLLGMSSAFV